MTAGTIFQDTPDGEKGDGGFFELGDDEVRSELTLILESAYFARSERSCRFLRYVCELALAGQASSINEHLIGIEVFERGSTYSPAEDAIVRRQAYAVRHKLEAYYANEGRDDQIRITLPTGHYVPVFRRQSDPGILDHSNSSRKLPETQGGISTWFDQRLAAAAFLGVLATLIGGWLLGKTGEGVSAKASEAVLSAATLEVWNAWLDNSVNPVICLSNPMTTLVRELKNPVPPHSLGRHFMVPREGEESIRGWFGLGPQSHIYLVPSVSQAKMGDALAAGAIANLLGRAGVRARFTQSRFLTWEDLRSENVILLGHPETNPWMVPLLQDYPLRLTKEPVRIVNAEPRAGEPAEYFAEGREGEGPTYEYSLISMLPSEDKDHQLLVIAGLYTQATQVAAEFLTDDSRLEEVVQKFTQAKPTQSGPWSFQIVIRTSVRDKTPTGRGEIVALRVL